MTYNRIGDGMVNGGIGIGKSALVKGWVLNIA